MPVILTSAAYHLRPEKDSSLLWGHNFTESDYVLTQCRKNAECHLGLPTRGLHIKPECDITDQCRKNNGVTLPDYAIRPFMQ